MRKNGFTLAEVLITLTIIGVIAALTISTLMKKYDKHVSEIKIKKLYSYMSNSIQYAMKNNDCDNIMCLLLNNGLAVRSSNASMNSFGYTLSQGHILGLLKIIFNTDNITYDKQKKCIPDAVYRLDGHVEAPYQWGSYTYNSYYCFNGETGIAIESNLSANVQLKHCDGTFHQADNHCIRMKIFTDGARKKAIYGKNVFGFSVNYAGTPLIIERLKIKWRRDQFTLNYIRGHDTWSYDRNDALGYLILHNWKMDYLE